MSGCPARVAPKPATRPCSSISGMGSAVRPPICTTWMVVESEPMARATTHRIAFEILTVGHQHDDPLVIAALGIALEQIAGVGRARARWPCRRRACRWARAAAGTARRPTPSAVRGKPIGSPAKATAREAGAAQLLDQTRDLHLGAEDARGLDVLRVHALRVVEHDHHIDVGRGDEPGALAVLRPRRGYEARAPSPARAARPSRRAASPDLRS